MILHVACLPFPTHQGTQAAIAAMLKASSEAGRQTHLLAYAQAAYELDAPYEIHRIPNFPNVRSLRSGPSWGKVALDARCVGEIRKLARQLQPRAIVAHHIEAALAALGAGVAPVYYVAHTSLECELPVYLPGVAKRLVGKVGRRVERQVCARAAGVAAVAPSLAALLGDEVRYLPVPWPSSPGTERVIRNEARLALGLVPDAHVCLYAGNLDRYQGWEDLVEAISLLRQSDPKARLLVATASDPAPVRKVAERLGAADAIVFCGLGSEQSRMLAHAASDLAWVPRRTVGGLPIKMLDAFARELPVIATERATAGLPLQRACSIIPNDSPRALARAAESLLDNEGAANALRDGARRYLALHHSAEWFSTAMRHLMGEPLAPIPRRRSPSSTYGPTRLFLDPN